MLVILQKIRRIIIILLNSIMLLLINKHKKTMPDAITQKTVYKIQYADGCKYMSLKTPN